MRKRKTLTVLVFSLFSIFLIAQETVSIEGYVYESGNRGYLNLAKVTILDPITGSEKALLMTDENGVFTCELPVGKEYELFVVKDLFKQYIQSVSTVGKKAGEKVFVKCLMERKPGYIFDVTIAEKRKEADAPTNAITGATIEVYNNSTDEQLLTLIDHPKQEFKCHFSDGNHYTVLIRKKGFFNKRMEAFVNVKGCILCFEGVGEIKPSDVLTEGNTMGTLLANVELEPIKMDEGIKIENIYYDYDKSDITDVAAFELDKLINVLNINPALVVELGSHTDSRGDDDYNFKLSSDRAKSAMTYIIQNSDIEDHRIRYQGYGERQIQNKCKNGVSCSDQLHAENRRTELKVVGLLDIDPFKNKSLQEIIEAEKFDKMLAELQNQEQVKVTGDEVPDFIKAQEEKKELAIEAAELEEAEEAIEEVEEVAASEAPIAEKMLEDVDKVTIVEEETKVPAIERLPDEIHVVSEIDETVPVEGAKVETAKEILTEVSAVDDVRDMATAEVKEMEEVKTPEVGIKEVVVTEEVTNAVVDKEAVTTKVDSVKSEIPNKVPVKITASSSDLKLYEASAVATPRPTPRPISLPEGYSGYRVEFFNSPYELPPSHEIFYRHGRITMDRTKEGNFSYLLGAFKELKDAEGFLLTIIQKQYPEGKVIKYKKGNRTNG